MVPLLLGLLAHPVGESQRLGKVTKPEHALQALDAFPLHHLPLGDPRSQLRDLCFGQRGFAASAGGALHLRQLAHIFLVSVLASRSSVSLERSAFQLLAARLTC
jgi:hypothetical protein